MDAQVLKTLAMPNDGFANLVLAVGVVVGVNDPAGAPVAGVRAPRCRTARTANHPRIEMYGFTASHHQVIVQAGERRLHMLSKSELLERRDSGKQQDAGYAERDHQFENTEPRLEALTCAVAMNNHLTQFAACVDRAM